jgi:hypothetical protein
MASYLIEYWVLAIVRPVGRGFLPCFSMFNSQYPISNGLDLSLIERKAMIAKNR